VIRNDAWSGMIVTIAWLLHRITYSQLWRFWLNGQFGWGSRVTIHYDFSLIGMLVLRIWHWGPVRWVGSERALRLFLINVLLCVDLKHKRLLAEHSFRSVLVSALLSLL
jgi:hypothetical protein